MEEIIGSVVLNSLFVFGVCVIVYTVIRLAVKHGIHDSQPWTVNNNRMESSFKNISQEES